MKMRNGLDFLQDEYLLKHVIPAKAGTQVYIKKIHHRIEVKIDYEKRLGLGPRFRRGDIFGNWLSIKTITLFLFLFTSPLHASIQQTAPNNITFGTSASAPQGLHPAMYVGASARLPAAVANDPKTIPYKLSRISLQTTSNITTTYNVLQPFVSSKTTVNGTEGPHPLADVTSSVAQLAVLAGQYPVFTVAKAAAGGAAPTFGGLHLITDAAGSAISSAAPLVDQEKAEVTAVPAALTAGSTVAIDPQAGTPLIGNTFVFAAVSKAGTQFDNVTQKTRGIAVMQYHPATTTGDAQTPAELKQINAANIAGGDAQALSVNMSAQPADGAAVIAFGDGTANSIERAVVGRAASMAWDQGLERLYLGFTGARRNDPEKLGGVLGICMAYPEYTDASANKVLQNFSVAPFVDAPSNGLFSSALQNQIFEMDNPTNAFGANVAPSLLIGALPADLVVPYAATGFSVALKDIKICLKVLKAAIEYVRANGGNNADQLLAHLRDPAGAGIFAAGGPLADTFLNNPVSPWTQSVVFGVTIPVIAPASNVANSAASFRDAIRTRFVQLLKNAKIVNQAYATGNFTNSVYTNSLDMIVGLYADGQTLRIDEETGIAQARNDGDDDLAVSIPHLAVMNTSTGRPYLIAHSIMTTSPIGIGGTMYTEADNWVYALPLIKDAPNGRADLKGSLAAVTNDVEGVGKIALTIAGPGVKGNEYQVPLELAGQPNPPAVPIGIGMPKRFHKAARVGGGNPIKGSWIKDIFVAGDAVYVALAGLLPSQQGVFKSTAIFDKDGCIINWTPATRVMGGVQQTFAAMLDTTTASFYALTQASSSTTPGAAQAPAGTVLPPVQLNGATTAQITKWGKGQAHMHGDNAAWSLDAVLGGMFDQKKGGVHGLIPFDELTYGFPPDKLSLLMAYGFDSIAIAKTGEHDGVAFRPVKEHFASGAKKNVWNFNAGISDIKPVTCGAVVHNPQVGPPPVNGWTRFYVGGYQGLAMLEIAYPDSVAFKTNLIRAANAGGPFIPAGVPGVQAKDQIVAVGEAVTRGGANGAIDHRYLHVLTQNGVVVNEIPAANVAGGAFVPAHVVIANLQNVLDGVVLADGTLVATATGLNFVSADGTVVTPIPIGDVIPLQIQVLPSRNTDGLFELPATVYVLGMGTPMPDDVVPGAHAAVRPPSTTLVTQLWRIVVYKDVAGAVQSAILDKYAPVGNAAVGQDRPYAQYPNLRLNFSADGSLLFDASSRDGTHNDFLRVGSLAAPEPVLNNFALGQKSITSLLDIDQSKSFRIGIPVRDAATGAWLVPGDWGLRVNE